MQRRLKVALTELTSELVSFREVIGRGGLQGGATNALVVGLTIVFTVLTVAVVILTGALLAKG